MVEESLVLNNRYKLLARAGSGGMASVYKAHDQVLGRIVAIKLLHEGLTGDDSFLKRFRHEAHAAANLTHPNIVTVHDVGQDDRFHYIVMEYVEGNTLKQIVKYYQGKNRPMSVNRGLDLIIQVCAGIGYAHRSGLVHCDVKPHNVIVTRDLRVKVADFGIARAVSESSQDIRSVVWGTPQYFSPEQAAGKSPTPASDVYSIGVMLYEMLANQLPFAAESPAAMALKHINEDPAPIRQKNPKIDKSVARIVQKILNKEPAGRYRTAGQLGRVLESYRETTRQMTNALPTVHPDDLSMAAIAGNPTTDTTPIHEQKTIAPFQNKPDLPTTGQTPVRITIPQPAPMTHPVGQAPGAYENKIVALGIVAIIAVLGLIPLWWAVYTRWQLVAP